MRAILLTACLGSTAAHAEAVDLSISGSLPTSAVNNFIANTGGIAGFQWVQEAESFVGSLQGSAFSIQVAYDTETARSGAPLAFRDGISFAGSVIGNISDFTEWAPTITLGKTSNSASLRVEGWKRVFEQPSRPGRNQNIYFILTATLADPSALTSSDVLPSGPLTLADFSSFSGEIGYRGGDAGGPEYAFWRIENVGSLDLRAVSAVPEPGTWALFAAGLIGVAGLARRQMA